MRSFKLAPWLVLLSTAYYDVILCILEHSLVIVEKALAEQSCYFVNYPWWEGVRLVYTYSQITGMDTKSHLPDI